MMNAIPNDQSQPHGPVPPRRRLRGVVTAVIMGLVGVVTMAGLLVAPAFAQSGGPVDPGPNSPRPSVYIHNDTQTNFSFTITGTTRTGSAAANVRAGGEAFYANARAGAQLEITVRDERNIVIMSATETVPATATNSDRCTFEIYEIGLGDQVHFATFICHPA